MIDHPHHQIRQYHFYLVLIPHIVILDGIQYQHAEVNDEIKRAKSLLEEVQKRKKEVETFWKMLNTLNIARRSGNESKTDKYNYEEAQKIWNQLKKGTKFKKLITSKTRQ